MIILYLFLELYDCIVTLCYHCISIILSECEKHCTLCYNETECYECVQGYFLDTNSLCERKYIVSNISANVSTYLWNINTMNTNVIMNVATIFLNLYNHCWLTGCMDKYCLLCYNATSCFECAVGYFLAEDGECRG